MEGTEEFGSSLVVLAAGSISMSFRLKSRGALANSLSSADCFLLMLCGETHWLGKRPVSALDTMGQAQDLPLQFAIWVYY